MAGSSGAINSYNIVYQLNAVVSASFRRSVGEAEDSIEDVARVLRELSRISGFDNVRRDADAAEDSVGELGESASKLGRILEGMKGQKELFSELKSGVEPLKKIMTGINESADAMAQLQASTGMTTEQMEDMEEISNSLYRQNYGKGFEDLGDSLALVKKVLQQSGDELEKTTENAITYRDVFKGELPDSLKAVDAMMQRFGINSEQAYNLMAQGAQKGLDRSGELLDTTSEYSVYFDKMGYSANEMFSLFSAGIENGASSLGGVADAVKEFSTAIMSDSDSVSASIYELFAPEQLDKFSAALVKGGAGSAEYAQLLKVTGKTVADTLTKDLKAGGDSAKKAMLELQKTLGSGEKIFKGLSNGSLTGKQAMEQVIQKLKEIKDPVKQAQLAGELFGSQFSAIGSEAVLALGSTRSQFDMTKQTMEEVAAVKYSTLTQQFQAVGREMMTELIVPLGEKLMPLLQGLVHWMGNNKELMMVIGLGAPAAAIGVNTLKIVQGFLKIGSAAGGAGGAAGGFAGALGLLTNPVGIAVGALGLVTAGVVAYKHHQENARQELLHMGDALDEAGEKYEAAQGKAKLTNDLVWEYRHLNEKIKESSTSSEGLAKNTETLARQQERLREVTTKLQELHPKTISQYDIENGKIEEKLDLMKQESDAEKDLAKITLENKIYETEDNLPELEKEMTELQNSSQNLAMKKDMLDPAISDLKKFEAEYERLMQLPNSDKKNEQLEELRQKVNTITGEVGFNVEGTSANFDDINRLPGLKNAIKTIKEKRDKGSEELQSILEKQVIAQDTYETLYDNKKSLIEKKLGGTLEEQAAKYKTLSDAQKLQFQQAMEDVSELNAALSMMPSDKKINVMLIWGQTGQFPQKIDKFAKKNGSPDLRTVSGREQHRLQLRDPGFEGYAGFADGGIALRPSIFGEAGPEIAIPLNNKPRSRSLLDKANDLMGYTSSTSLTEGNIQVNWAPQVTIQGGTPSIAAEVAKAIQDQQPAFEQRFQQMIQQQRRVSF
ncbi:phage tail tape measure protein [Paenibacillus sp. sgz500992]|uniref:phage tail tape measure protein n=1 Tax=Paenibacillus sp. sgz500992 TaxID=3242476 RepID=UPI0036D22061